MCDIAFEFLPTMSGISGSSPRKQLISDNIFRKPVLPTPNNFIRGIAEMKGHTIEA